jgi:hypothetical protein
MTAGFALQPRGAGGYAAHTDPRYWNQIGPFGGWLAGLAAAALQGEAPPGWVMQAVSVQFLGRVPPGPVDVTVEALRQQRRVAGLRATLRPAGDGRVAVTADAVFGPPPALPPRTALRRPALPDAASLPRLAALDPLAAFVGSFDLRPAFGAPFAGEREPRSGGWLRSRRPLPPGAAGLLMLADAWFPPAWAARSEPVPVSTISMQVVFHDTDPGSSAIDGFFAACYQEDGRSEAAGLERGALWWPDGRLALTQQQLTWVGEPAPAKEQR